MQIALAQGGKKMTHVQARAATRSALEVDPFVVWLIITRWLTGGFQSGVQDVKSRGHFGEGSRIPQWKKKEAIIFILLSSLNHIITESVAFYRRGWKPNLVEWVPCDRILKIEWGSVALFILLGVFGMITLENPWHKLLLSGTYASDCWL